MKRSAADVAIDIFIHVFLVIIAFLALFPFLNMLSISLSSSAAIMGRKISIFPVGLNLEFYQKIFTDQQMYTSFAFTVKITVIYVVLALAATVLGAYPLSRKRLKGRRVFGILITITMYFSGGIVPTFLIVQKFGLLDSMWSLVVPGLINAYYLIIMKSFFMSIPESLTEAAIIDGCTEFGVLLRIVLPLSLPVLATMVLFYAVHRWNGFQDALFYITDLKKMPLQLKLRAMVLANQINDKSDIANQTMKLNTDGLKAATLIYATLPILLIYPWLQKYFVKGMTMGSVKE